VVSSFKLSLRNNRKIASTERKPHERHSDITKEIRSLPDRLPEEEGAGIQKEKTSCFFCLLRLVCCMQDTLSVA
jgi:hypothetical protein